MVAEWEAETGPLGPHDHLSFDELAVRYNFLKTSNRRTTMVRMILDEIEKCPGPARVLDIGAGEGIGRMILPQQVIASSCDELWGVEPDEGIKRTDGVFKNYQHAMMETADLPEDYFDIAYAYMVMEHVADPVAFLKAVKRCLKPGGVFLFVTPNGKHYFTILANMLKTLRIDEFTLRVIRRKSLLEDYHYPVTYRFNTPRQIDKITREVGMEQSEYVYLESDGPRPYMRGPLRPLFHLLRFKRSIIKNPRVLLIVAGRITKPSANESNGVGK